MMQQHIFKKIKRNDEHEEVVIPYGGVEEIENPEGEETEDLIVLYKKNLQNQKIQITKNTIGSLDSITTLLQQTILMSVNFIPTSHSL